MSKEKKRKGEKSEVKLIIIFLLILVAAYWGGYFFGTMGARYEEGIKNVLQVAANGMINLFPILYVVINVVVIVSSLFIYINARKNARLWDGESEEVINEVETKLNWSLTPLNILTALDLFFYGAMVYISEYTKLGEVYGDELFVLGTVTFVLSYAFIVILTKCIVDLVKKLNPEKRGSIFDLQFVKEWENSSDEAERLIMYKAAYKAYHAVTVASMSMWVVAFCGMIVFQTGLLPLFCVTAIWVTSITSYSIACAKLEGKR